MKGPARSGVQPDVRRRIADAASAAADAAAARGHRRRRSGRFRCRDPLARSVAGAPPGGGGAATRQGATARLAADPSADRSQRHSSPRSRASQRRSARRRHAPSSGSTGSRTSRPPRPARRSSSTTIRRQALARLDPARTVRERALGRITIPPSLRPTVPRRIRSRRCSPRRRSRNPPGSSCVTGSPSISCPGSSTCRSTPSRSCRRTRRSSRRSSSGINHELGRELLGASTRPTSGARRSAGSGQRAAMTTSCRSTRGSAHADLGSSVVRRADRPPRPAGPRRPAAAVSRRR